MTVPDPAPLEAALAEGLHALGLDVSAPQRQQLIAHLLLIVRWNRVYNLTAVREPADMVTQHLLDSLAAVPVLRREFTAPSASGAPGFAPTPVRAPTPEPGRLAAGAVAAPNQETPSVTPAAMMSPPPPALAQAAAAPATLPHRVLDVGSGAGLPGVPLAILHPGWSVTCLDAVAKKAGFLRQVAAELGLRNLLAEHRRVEDWQPAQGFPLITSRAFASLADFVALTRHLLAPGGRWMAMKGQTPQDELASLPPDVEVFHVEPLQVPGLDAQRCLVWMRKKAS